MQLFNRKKAVEVNQADDGSLVVAGHFKDKFHEIKTLLVIDPDTKLIKKAEAKMITVPFDLCHEAALKMAELSGINAGKGITKMAREVVGGPRGCAHLMDMVIDSAKVLTQVTGFCLMPREMSFDEKLEKIKEINMGICHTYSNLDRNPTFIGNREI